MKVLLSRDVLKLAQASAVSKEIKTWTWGDRRYNIADIEKDIPLLLKLLQSDECKGKSINTQARRVLSAHESLKTSGKDARVKDLQGLEVLLRSVCAKAKNRWVFRPHAEFEWMVPYLVKNVRYKEAERYNPARVEVTLTYVERGTRHNISKLFYRADCLGRPTAIEALENASIYLADDTLCADYELDMVKYKNYAPATGEQVLGSGYGMQFDTDDYDYRWWKKKKKLPLEVEAAPGKYVLDDMEDQDSGSDAEETSFYEDDDDDCPDAGKGFPVPVHPSVKIFDLKRHIFLTAHVADLKFYQYDKNLIHKLVLPAEHKELIDALTCGVAGKMDDLIAGKGAGVIVMCSGVPGTGKTLTAEVYSENIGRPLYAVQCSQLGTNDATLEKNLGEILQRATRWRAVLLIDESDVYIHERGSDVSQNAIVGVFLRLLEYYNGMLFLTTNRATVVDDAIISRVTAHVRYAPPEGADRERLWCILAQQFKLEFTDALLANAIKTFPKVSGRSIRQLLRLGKFLADQRKSKLTLEHLKLAAKYHDFADEEK